MVTTTEYLDTAVKRPLGQALADLCLVGSADPVSFVSNWLRNYANEEDVVSNVPHSSYPLLLGILPKRKSH